MAELVTVSSISLAARALSWLYGLAKQRWVRPKLVVSAAPERPFIDHTTLDLPTIGPVQRIEWAPVDYYRLRVQNLGGLAVNGCRLQMVGLMYVEHGVWREYVEWEPVTLIWSRRADEQQITISSDETVFCDVGHYHSNLFQSNAIRPGTHRALGQRPRDGRAALFYLDGRNMPRSQPSALAAGTYYILCKLLCTDHPTQAFAVRLTLQGHFASIARDVPEETRFEAAKKVPEVQTVYSWDT